MTLSSQPFSKKYKIVRRNKNPLCGAIAALSFLLLLPATPAFAEVSCQPLQRGTLGEDGVFTPGTQASDTDFYVACTGSGGEDDRIGWSDFFDSADASGADEFPDEARRNPNTRLILEIDNAYADLGSDQYLPDDAQSRYRLVISGKVRADGDWTGSGINTWVGETLSTDLNIESHADIHTTGTAEGISVNYSNEIPEGSIRLRNFGNVLTEGEGTGENPRRAHGVALWAPAGEAEFSNEAGATIETRGRGARGAAIFGAGGAMVVNHGSITTTGDPITNPDGSRIRQADTVYAGLEGLEGTAQAVNEAGATIRTEGKGARSLYAVVCAFTGEHCDPNARGTATAINRGSVTNTGDTFVSPNGETRRPSGVHAVLDATSGTARAVNEAGATIRTEGTGARAIEARACAWTGGACRPEGRGVVIAINRGSVVTVGEEGYGVYASADGAGATAQAINEGSIRTEGAESSALRTWLVGASSPSSETINRASGQIETFGDGAEGVFALSRGGGSEASTFTGSTNEGSVVTHGIDSEAVIAIAVSGGTETHPTSVRSINRAGATIETVGDGASGLNASILVGLSESGPGRLDAFGTARSENHGTITTAGGVYAEHLARGGPVVSGAPGVTASFWPWEDETEIGNAGDVTVVNTGSVRVTGGSAGLSARTFGTGSATVSMTGGSVTSGAMDDPATATDESTFGIGIYAVVHTSSTTDDPSDDTDVHITVSGPMTTVTAHGGADDPITDALDESRGIGILAQTGASGHIEVEVSGGATITADRAAVFEGGRTTFTLDGSTLVGDVEFASLNDHMTVRNGLVDGDVHFGDGMDTLVLDVPDSGGIAGRITGLEELLKRGAGVARIFDAELADNALAVEEGELSVSGHLNLGSQGTLTVHDSARLSVEVGDLAADAGDHGQITAGQGVIYEGLEEDEAPELFLQLAPTARANADAIQAALEENPVDVLGENTRLKIQSDAGPVDAGETRLSTTDADGSAREIGSLQEDGQVSLAADATLGEPPPVEERPRSGGGGGNAGVILLGGGALIAAVLMDSLGEDETALAEWERATSDRRTTTSFAGIRSGNAIEHRVRSGGLEHWTRTFAGDSPTLADGAAGTLRGIATGLDANLAGGFRLGAAAMPELSMSSGPGPASEYDSSLNGSHYSFRGGWRGAHLFTDATLSQGRYRAQSLFDNPVSGGFLGGEFNLVRRQVHGRAGARLGFGSLRATPSLSLFSGSLRQDAHTAESASLRAEVPGVFQRYQGWKAALNLAPSDWLGGPRALRWRPGLHLASMRTRTQGPAMLDVRQSDKAGVLSFSSQARARALPHTVHSFGASVTAMRSDSWRLRMGYAGMVVDDEPIHAAVARLSVPF